MPFSLCVCSRLGSLFFALVVFPLLVSMPSREELESALAALKKEEAAVTSQLQAAKRRTAASQRQWVLPPTVSQHTLRGATQSNQLFSTSLPTVGNDIGQIDASASWANWCTTLW